MKAAFLGFALLLAPGLALRVGLSRRAALHSAATATAGLCVAPAHAEDVSAARAKILAAKKESEERLERLNTGPTINKSDNPAEQKLQEMLKIRVAEQEKSLGFKFEPEDVAEVEKILRNKYCGKAGLYGSMQGGTCAENTIDAAFCTTKPGVSSSAGCEQPKPPPPPREPPKVPTLPSLPSLPF